MEINEKQILDLITQNIISEISDIRLNSRDAEFKIEKILLNCGLDESHIPTAIDAVKRAVYLNQPADYVKTITDNFVNGIFEDKKKIDKIAVRNKQSGAIQLVSKKTYQANSQLYTPLSAGWAKANVVMVRNKTSGEEYPILLKNFDSNKHEKVGTATPPEDTDKQAPLKAKSITTPKSKQDTKKEPEDTLDKSKDTSTPIMVEPSLQSKTMTAFITPKSAEKQAGPPEFPSNEDDVIKTVEKSIKDKKLNKNNPLDSDSFKKELESTEDDYAKLGSAGLLPSDFNINKKYSIPSSLKVNTKIPRSYISIIEKLANTINGNVTPISAYNFAVALNTNPNTTLSLFELLLLYSVTLDNEDFSKLSISIDMFIKNNASVNLTSEMWQAVTKERNLILNYIRKKYENNFNIVAGSWKIEEHQLELGLDNSDIDIEKISDIFLRINTNAESDSLEEFLVTPNSNRALAVLDKEKFKEYVGTSKESMKAKMLMFLLKMFPLQAILKNEITIVFSDVIFDYYSMIELFKTESIENLELKLKSDSKKIILSYAIENKRDNMLSMNILDKTISIEIDKDFYNKSAVINKKIYKNI